MQNSFDFAATPHSGTSGNADYVFELKIRNLKILDPIWRLKF